MTSEYHNRTNMGLPHTPRFSILQTLAGGLQTLGGWWAFPLPLYRLNYLIKGMISHLIALFLPVYLISYAGVSPRAAAFFTVIGNLPLVFRPLLGRLIDRVTARNEETTSHLVSRKGHPVEKWILLPTLAVITAGFIILTRVHPGKAYGLFLGIYAVIIFGIVLVDVVLNHLMLGVRDRLREQMSISRQLGVLAGGAIIFGTYNLLIGSNILGSGWNKLFMLFGALYALYLGAVPFIFPRNNNLMIQAPPVPQPRNSPVEGTQLNLPGLKPMCRKRRMGLSPQQSRNIMLWLLFLVLSRAETMVSGIMGPDMVARFGPAALQSYSLIYSYGIYIKLGVITLLVILKTRLTPFRQVLLIFAVLPWVLFYAGIIWNIFPLVMVGTALGVATEPLATFGFLLLYAEVTPDENKNFWFQLFAAVGGLTTILCQAGGMILWEVFGSTIVYIIAFGLAQLALIPVFRLQLEKVTPPEPPAE